MIDQTAVADIHRILAEMPQDSKTIRWRSDGLKLADAQLRAARPGATASDVERYRYALLEQTAMLLHELQRLPARPAKNGEDAA